MGAQAAAGNVVAGNPIINDPYAEPSRHWSLTEVTP